MPEEIPTGSPPLGARHVPLIAGIIAAAGYEQSHTLICRKSIRYST